MLKGRPDSPSRRLRSKSSDSSCAMRRCEALPRGASLRASKDGNSFLLVS